MAESSREDFARTVALARMKLEQVEVTQVNGDLFDFSLFY